MFTFVFMRVARLLYNRVKSTVEWDIWTNHKRRRNCSHAYLILFLGRVTHVDRRAVVTSFFELNASNRCFDHHDCMLHSKSCVTQSRHDQTHFFQRASNNRPFVCHCQTYGGSLLPCKKLSRNFDIISLNFEIVISKLWDNGSKFWDKISKFRDSYL